MDNYIEFQRYPDLDSASELIDILETNEIEYQIDDTALRYDIAATSMNPLDKQIIVKIKDADLEKATKLFATIKNNVESDTYDDHYLYTFSDNDIIDVIANPDEWTAFEVDLAKKIFKDRELKPTAELIKSTRKTKIEEQTKNAIKKDNTIKGSYTWFLLIGVLSIVNSIDVLFHQRLYFIFGLGITRIVDSIIFYSQNQFIVAGLIINIIVSSIFILLWYYAKKKKNWAFLTGLIFYGVDTLIFIFYKDWLSTGFHAFVFIGIYAGYKMLKQKDEKTSA